MTYSVGEQVRFSVTISSTGTTAPEGSDVSLIVTSPAGVDTTYAKAALVQTPATSGDSTSIGAVKFYRDVLINLRGRWSYQFKSTGLVVGAAGGAIAAIGPHASTST